MTGRVVRAYAALGDSFTAGRDSIDAERWPDLMAAAMRRVNPELRYENLAVDGATSAEVLERQVEPGLALEPDFVTVICGANDVLLATQMIVTKSGSSASPGPTCSSSTSALVAPSTARFS